MSSSAKLKQLFRYYIKNNHANRWLFLLHGTGGNETDLIPLAEAAANDYNYIGLRGNILEYGMNRFFIRKAFGEFDQKSIKQEADKLAEFIGIFSREHQLSPQNIAFLGYSNGANFILATAFHHPQFFHQTVILHPMLPFIPKSTLDLSHSSWLLTFGQDDPMTPPHQSQQVIEQLTAHQAKIEIVTHAGGHEIAKQEIGAIKKFLQ